MWVSMELRGCMNVFIVSISNESERSRNLRIQNAFGEILCLRSNLRNDDKISF